MVARNECQALYIAMEMERRAIRVYERALMLTEDAQVRSGIQSILEDERTHLREFEALRACHPVDAGEEKQLLVAMGAEVLFPGGVMEMKRERALSSMQALYRYAAQSEAGAVQTYGEFANECTDPAVRNVFLDIVREESTHLTVLQEKLREMNAPLN